MARDGAAPKMPLKQKIGLRLQKLRTPRPKLSHHPATIAEAGPPGPKGPQTKVGSREEITEEKNVEKTHSTEVTKTAEATPNSPQREYLTTPSTAQQFKEDQRQEKNSLANVEFEVAEGFADGGNIPPDPQKAREYYQRAAEKGHAQSLYRLGMEYLSPPGAEAPDPTNAVVWLERAAAQGHADSQHQLGEIYLGNRASDLKGLLRHWLAASNNQHLLRKTVSEKCTVVALA